MKGLPRSLDQLSPRHREEAMRQLQQQGRVKHITYNNKDGVPCGVATIVMLSKRIKQDTKPKMNKLESDWLKVLSCQFPNYPRPRGQEKRYLLANGAWYRPDITTTLWPCPDGPARETAWECKGPKQMKNVARGILTLKVAAHQWPEVRWVLVWRERGEWLTQEVLP
jgi:hypothetical protein